MRIYAYYTTWSIYARKSSISDIPLNSVTHLTVAFAKMKANGIIDDGDIEKLNLNMKKPPKLGIAIGGWGNHEEFSKALTRLESRSRFIDSCAKLAHKHSLDYLELDWEFPKGKEDISAYIETIKMLRERLKAEIELGICLPCYLVGLERFEVVNNAVDYFVVMGYDQSGPWSQVSGYHSALKPFITEHINYLISQALIPRQKIVLAIPTYGRTFKECKAAGQKFTGPGRGSYGEEGLMDYGQIVDCAIEIKFDPDAVSNYASLEDEFISFDGIESVEQKVDWIKSEYLSGIAIWNISGDAKNCEKSLLIRIASRMKNE